jgi:hypothetical protein
VNKLRVQWANSGEEAMEVFPAVYVTWGIDFASSLGDKDWELSQPLVPTKSQHRSDSGSSLLAGVSKVSPC